jgi:hypothetical protein
VTRQVREKPSANSDELGGFLGGDKRFGCHDSPPTVIIAAWSEKERLHRSRASLLKSALLFAKRPILPVYAAILFVYGRTGRTANQGNKKVPY